MEVMCNNYIPGDSRLIEVLVSELKSQGIFDQFRKECISDVDTKPAYQNLKQRVEGSVTTFLKQQTWSVDLNKNQLREQLRKNLYESGFLETGVERIVDQVVNPKINTVFLPKVEEIFYRVLGVDKPVKNVKKEVSITDLLPTDLEAVSPESVHSFKVGLKKDCDTLNDSFPSSTKLDEDESPPFEPLNGNTENNTSFDEKIIVDENTRDSHLSGFSGLESHDSNPGSGDNRCYQMELSNQDSQGSQISSESHLSIVTSEDTTKMEVCEDSNIENNVEKSEEVNVIDETENNIKNDVIKQSENKNLEDKKSKSSEKSSKDRKDDKQRKSSSSSKDKDKSSSKSSYQSKNKESRDKDKRDSKGGSSRDKDKPKEKPDKDKEKSDREKSSKKSDKEKYKSDKERSDKVKADRSKFEKEAANKMEKEKIEKDRSKDRSDKSKSERDRSKSETDKSKLEKDKSNREKDRNTKDKYKEKSFKTKEKSDKDKEKSSKDKSSRDRSSSSKDTKEIRENKESNKEGKDKTKEESKEKNKSSSSSSKYSSSKDKKPSTPKKESNSQSTYKDKSSSSSSAIDLKSKTVPEKPKKDETIDKYSSNKKDKQKDSKKKSKDDHYSSKINKTDRRSTDRDSNDGQSSKNYSNSYSESSRSENNSQGYTSSSFTGGSGDSSNSDQVDAANIEENTKVNEEVIITEIPKVKYSKPKFALNFEEARRIMKIRKQLALLEKQNKLSLTKIELPFENCILKKTEDVVNIHEVKENISISKQDSEIINENKLAPTIEGTDLSKENWEALEAKLAQVMAEVNCNSYESDEDFEFHGYSPVETTPKHLIELSMDLVKKTEMEMINKQIEYQNNKENSNDEDNLSSKLIPNNNFSVNKNKNGLSELIKIIPNNCQQLSVILRTSINTNEDDCYYLEKPNQEEEWNLRYIKELISKLEKEVDSTIQCPTDNPLQKKGKKGKFEDEKKGKKRKFEDVVVDMKNNNKTNYMETVKKRRLSASSHSVIAAANKKRISSTDITPTEVFPLPLSPAESDKSNERKDEDLLIPIKQKRIVRGYSQRYSSEDLYKPRPTFGSRRNKISRRNV